MLASMDYPMPREGGSIQVFKALGKKKTNNKNQNTPPYYLSSDHHTMHTLFKLISHVICSCNTSINHDIKVWKFFPQFVNIVITKRRDCLIFLFELCMCGARGGRMC